MTNAPERIWAHDAAPGDSGGIYVPWRTDGTPYVRADLTASTDTAAFNAGVRAACPGTGRFTDLPRKLRRVVKLIGQRQITDGQAVWISDVAEDAALKIEALLRPEAPAPEPVACPCTLFEQDESCPVGFPSMVCGICDGTGHTTGDKVTALATEMLRIASDLGEAEDPFAAWESAHPAPVCTATDGPPARCVYREPLLRTQASTEHG